MSATVYARVAEPASASYSTSRSSRFLLIRFCTTLPCAWRSRSSTPAASIRLRMAGSTKYSGVAKAFSARNRIAACCRARLTGVKRGPVP